MKLSIVIVNYNVKHFLDQCLTSVRKAIKGIDAEVFVVDNNSVDSSTQMLREKYPEVILIANKENVGFSAANNQAIREAKGDYILLLNPDTVLEDDTLTKCVEFMDAHPDAGGLGVNMIDGKGNFLPESKRGLPTPDVAFYKVFGLSKLFPKSKVFGKYHLGYLNRDEIHEVDVLSGAFMMLRKTVLDETGLLDEAFFMYGEDIDLSYRITQAGYKNYYFPKTRIIHYKGESTKKGSVNYVFVFYNAMIIFAKKHFTSKNARLFSLLINLAIYFRASLAILNRFLKKALLPAIDFILLYGGLYLITQYWERNVIFPNGGQYPFVFKTIVEIGYSIIWIVSNYLSGGYDVPVKLRRIIRGLVLGTVFILVIYALLPESYRFSRAIILLGTLWGIVALAGTRLALHLLKFSNARLENRKNKRFIIVGDKAEAERVSGLLVNTVQQPGFIGLVSSNNAGKRPEGFIGTLGQITEIIMIYKIDEVIFCSKNLSHQKIMDLMSELQGTRVDYKIAPEDSLSIIGSNSINTQGDLYTIQINAITNVSNRRNKRLLDFTASLLLLLSLPVSLFVVRKPLGFIRNIFLAFFGKISWVGFHPGKREDEERLPDIRPGVLNPLDAFKERRVTEESVRKLNVLYARDYNPYGDVNIIWKGYRDLGRRPYEPS
jgi:GT2 family glycosyltransferase